MIAPRLEIPEATYDANLAEISDEIPSSIPFQDRFASIKTIRGVTLNKLGMSSERDTLKALNLDRIGTPTIEVVRVHLLKILLTILLSCLLCGSRLHGWWMNWLEIISNFWLQLFFLTDFTRERLRVKWGSSIVDSYYYSLRFLHLLPSVFLNSLQENLFCFSIKGLNRYRSSLPVKDIPLSISIIFEVNLMILAPPPPIPKSYLDANKVLQVPTKRQVQQAIHLRNEYMLQNRTHIAAERVRLITETSKFIVWNILQPTVHTLNVYERLAMLWEGNNDKAKLQLLKQSVINELHAFANNCNSEEFSELMAIVPQIILRDVYSGEQVEIESVLNDEIPERTLVVNLSDGRINSTVIEPTEYAVASILQQVCPSSDLIIVPGRNKQKRKCLLGYLAIDTDPSISSNSYVYYSDISFGFKLYARALFYYTRMVAKSQTKAKQPFFRKFISRNNDHGTSNLSTPVPNDQDAVNLEILELYHE